MAFRSSGQDRRRYSPCDHVRHGMSGKEPRPAQASACLMTGGPDRNVHVLAYGRFRSLWPRRRLRISLALPGLDHKTACSESPAHAFVASEPDRLLPFSGDAHENFERISRWMPSDKRPSKAIYCADLGLYRIDAHNVGRHAHLIVGAKDFSFSIALCILRNSISDVSATLASARRIRRILVETYPSSVAIPRGGLK